MRGDHTRQRVSAPHPDPLPVKYGERETTGRPAASPLLIVFCGLLLSVSAFSCDITLPAFWSMQQDLGAPIAWVQAVVPVFLIFQATGSSFSDPCRTATAAGRSSWQGSLST